MRASAAAGLTAYFLGCLTGAIVATMVAVVLLGCATPDPGPQPGDAWRRCEDECGQGVFLLDFGDEPPACVCIEDW